MKTLLEFAELGAFNNLLQEAQELEEALTDIMANAKSQHAIAQRRAANSNSKVTQFPVEELNHKMGEALKRLEAAYKGLGLTNKLTDPEQKLNNRSRIMSNIHKIRTILKDVESKLAAENQDVIGSQPQVPGVNENTIIENKEGSGFKTNLDPEDFKKAREAVLKNGGVVDGVRTRVINAATKKFKKKVAESKHFETNLEDEDYKKAREAVVKNGGVVDGVRTKVINAVTNKLKNKKIKEAWEGDVKLNPKKKGMFKGKNKAELESELAKLKKSGPHKKGSPEYTKEKELNFAIRAKSDWK